MSTRESIARHRAGVPKTNSIAVLAKAVSNNAGGMGRQAAVIAAASGLVLTSGIAANAAQPSTTHTADKSATTSKSAPSTQGTVTAASTVKVTFVKADVASTPAPVVQVQPAASQTGLAAPVAQPAAQVAQVAAPVAQPAAQVAAPVAQRAVQAAPVAAAPVAAAPVAAAPAAAPAPAKARAVASGVGATIVAAAYAQLGVHQDCTALVSNSLAAAGIYFHGWPAGYKALGHGESAAQAQPGDLIYYDNAGAGMPHIAVYIGNGQAIHGGMNGGNTEVATAYLGSGPVFIAIGH